MVARVERESCLATATRAGRGGRAAQDCGRRPCSRRDCGRIGIGVDSGDPGEGWPGTGGLAAGGLGHIATSLGWRWLVLWPSATPTEQGEKERPAVLRNASGAGEDGQTCLVR